MGGIHDVRIDIDAVGVAASEVHVTPVVQHVVLVHVVGLLLL